MITVPIGPLDEAEIKPVYFVFTGELPSGVTITSASIAVELLSGTDADPGAMKVGAAVIDTASRIVSQRMSGQGRAGNRYRLRCVATDGQANRHTVAAELAVVRL